LRKRAHVCLKASAFGPALQANTRIHSIPLLLKKFREAESVEPLAGCSPGRSPPRGGSRPDAWTSRTSRGSFSAALAFESVSKAVTCFEFAWEALPECSDSQSAISHSDKASVDSHPSSEAEPSHTIRPSDFAMQTSRLGAIIS
jgi:hypothetical protein